MPSSGQPSRTSRLAARLVHASVEGSAFLWTTDGIRAFLVLHFLAVTWALGPRKSVGIGLQCGLLCSAARFAVVLKGSGGKDSSDSLESIWDFSPPGQLGESGAWKVITELAKTLNGGGDAHEELRGLKSLPLSELLVRLIFLYRHLQENPISDLLDASEIVGEVTTDQVETLCHYLYLADQAYDCGTEDNLKTVLEEEGYELNFAKLSATWAEHRPAYFVATNRKSQELVLTIRGTAQFEDVVTDLAALPSALPGTRHMVHGGMLKSAIWLFERSITLCKALAETGYRITLVGHSLGAGAAAILALLFKNAGISTIACYAFAAPNCMDLDLAEECFRDKLVTSVALRDDIVARFSPEALAGLLQDLESFNLDDALEEAAGHDDKLVKLAAFIGTQLAGEDSSDVSSDTGKSEVANEKLSKNAQGSSTMTGKPDVRAPQSSQGDRSKPEDKKGPQNEQTLDKQAVQKYRAHIPGQVIYIYRKEGGQDREVQLAMVKSTCPALRQIRLSDQMVADHLIDSYFEGLGRENPSKIRKERLEQQDAGDDMDNHELKDKRRGKKAESRDQESKDEGRSWQARLGLVG